ncbi:MAG: FAD-dependent monooxygenase, partial [Candidatus Diapherotrites archaeon]|nr:FAD-dependent monooxygenase [Candidatus Diapherotrites archaeon]
MDAVTIIGAGPSGLRAAENLARDGWNVRVLEEHPKIGVPTHCSGLISKTGVQTTRLDLDGIVWNVIKGARIYAPNGAMLQVQKKDAVAYVIDRAGLDQKMALRAAKAGAQIELNTQLIDINGDKVFIKRNARGEMIKSKFIIGADGVNSKTRELIGIKLPQEKFVHSIQIRAKGNFDQDFVEVYLGDYAKNYFGWVIPESKTSAKIGFATTLGSKVKEMFQEFVSKKNFQVDQFEYDSA